MIELKLGSEDTEITADNLSRWRQITSRELSPEQIERLITPPQVYPDQEELLAVHWHPEFVPMDLIRRRINTAFPNRSLELIIPTQHNSILEYDGFSGVEIDCYAPEFNRKVQLLAHFRTSRLKEAHTLNEMINHTFEYRSRQLYDFIDTLLEPEYATRLQEAAVETGADEDMIRFTKNHTAKLKWMLDEYKAEIPSEILRNKLLRDYFNTLRNQFGDKLVDRVHVFLRSVKRIVKREFTLEYFYTAREVVEEVRSMGGCLVIPHPEQFWPILLANFDVDGYEVWNPQSREYTEFLVSVVDRQNRSRCRGEQSLMIFMGDDCHMGEKVRDPALQEPEKAGREIGVQPAWDDQSIKRSLVTANANRRSTIEEYRARLTG